ncbi:uncharacterized protein LOC113777954 [Coffea eugenioides]|uniref:uncharacterized protein LOC113749300 n=1 Tax=Coffea eugenioides TaxID=49369 RepID=UPI000F605D29|nr:uncharacterized protein LOC113749300 [Coffea eugenioides]XP_027178991.1 uncharacterized protein LOC113777954 [Coffea eugenioides]
MLQQLRHQMKEQLYTISAENSLKIIQWCCSTQVNHLYTLSLPSLSGCKTSLISVQKLLQIQKWLIKRYPKYQKEDHGVTFSFAQTEKSRKSLLLFFIHLVFKTVMLLQSTMVYSIGKSTSKMDVSSKDGIPSAKTILLTKIIWFSCAQKEILSMMF